jgi:hypothetical protein
MKRQMEQRVAMLVVIIVSILVIGIFAIGCKNDTTDDPVVTPLEGTWVDSFGSIFIFSGNDFTNMILPAGVKGTFSLNAAGTELTLILTHKLVSGTWQTFSATFIDDITISGNTFTLTNSVPPSTGAEGTYTKQP